jgi:hypothetical protein
LLKALNAFRSASINSSLQRLPSPTALLSTSLAIKHYCWTSVYLRAIDRHVLLLCHLRLVLETNIELTHSLLLLPRRHLHCDNDNDVPSNIASHALAKAQIITPLKCRSSFAGEHDTQPIPQRNHQCDNFFETIIADIADFISTSLARHTQAYVLKVFATTFIHFNRTAEAQWK